MLPPGTYSVVVNKSGFAEAKSEAIEVHVTETVRVTIPLKPGSVTEKVEISAQVTSVETLERHDRPIDRHRDGARTAAGDAELPAIA